MWRCSGRSTLGSGGQIVRDSFERCLLSPAARSSTPDGANEAEALRLRQGPIGQRSFVGARAQRDGDPGVTTAAFGLVEATVGEVDDPRPVGAIEARPEGLRIGPIETLTRSDPPPGVAKGCTATSARISSASRGRRAVSMPWVTVRNSSPAQ